MNPRPQAPASVVDLAELARSGGLLVLAGGSVALALAQLRGRWVDAFTRANQLPHGQRGVLLAALAAGIALGAVVVMALCALDARRGGTPRLPRVSRLAAPLVLAAFAPGLLRPDAWTDPVMLAVLIAGFILLFERLCRLHFEAYDEEPANPHPLQALAGRLPAVVRRYWPALVAGAAAAGYITYTSFFALRNHAGFNSYTWDLGQLDNQFYNFLHGHPFRCPALIREGNWSELRNHAEVAMVFLLPFYALHPAAGTLMVIQSALLGLAGLCVYRFAARRLSHPMALLLTGAYYFYPPLHGAQFFDIHFQPLSAAFLLAAIDFFDARRTKLFVLFFILGITCREDISVGTAVFGLFLIATRHRPKTGVIILAVSVSYFVLLRFAIMPAFGQWGFAEHYRTLFPEGEHSFAGIIKTILTNPVYTFTTLLTAEKLRYALQILAPLAFLPLRRAHLALSVVAGSYFTLLTDYGPTHDIGYQYSGYFIPYIFPASALALAAIRRGPQGVARQRAAVAALVAGTIITTTHWGAIPPRAHFHTAYGELRFEPPTWQNRAEQRYIDELMKLVPADAVLGVTDRELPHVSNRIETWNMSTGYQGIDYILYTTDHPIPTEREQYDAALRAGYSVAASRPGLVLLKRPGLK
ncbi:MAG TPA: DUF2079 domain-containing protein [Polyangia bacterium]|jgi:uncharacterized membrane protein